MLCLHEPDNTYEFSLSVAARDEQSGLTVRGVHALSGVEVAILHPSNLPVRRLHSRMGVIQETQTERESGQAHTTRHRTY